jgi:polyhydroxybutyrate depolymerase
LKAYFFSTLVTSLLLFSNCAKDPATPVEDVAKQTTETIEVDGLSRSYIQYLPQGWNIVTNLPVIFVLHGGTLGDPGKMLANVDYRKLADEEKFIAIYPAGVENNWNDGRPTDANLLGVDDVNFISSLIVKLATEYAVDEGAIFVTGGSNGGFMASRLGCELSSKIAAIAAVAATIEANSIYPNCNPENAVPALYIHGTLDKFVPIDGGEMTVGDGGFVVSHADAISKWLQINSITSAPIITNLPDIADDGTTITEARYLNSTTGVEVVSYVIENGGHSWPQGTGPNFPNLVGIRSMDMDAKQVIWNFFTNHKRN